MDATVDQRSLPLGYAWEKDLPDPEKICDSTNCLVQLDHDYSRLLTCGHSFHIQCMLDGSCPICLPNLLVKIHTVSTTFNAGLLKKDDDDLDDDEDEDDDDDENDIPNSSRSTSYYSSDEFRQSLKDRFSQKISEE